MSRRIDMCFRSIGIVEVLCVILNVLGQRWEMRSLLLYMA